MTNLAALLLALPCHISFLSSFLKPQIQSTISTKYGTMQSLAALSTTWVDNQGNDLNPLETADDELKVISYNILGPLHGESSKHFYAPTSITKWTRRRDKLLAVIKSTDADVVCLQEVSFKALKETFIPGLKPMGLKLSSYAGNKFSPTNKFSKGHKQIGCAIFVRDAKIETVVVRSTYLKEFAGIEHCSSNGFKYDVRGKHNCISMAFLRMINTNRTFIVANTHLFWDPERTDIKTIQTAAAVRAVAAFSNRTFNALKFNETAALALSESLSATNIGDDASDDDKDSINSDSDSLEVDDKDDVDGSSDSESLDDDSDDIDITNSADTESINSGGTSTDTDCILSTVASTDLQIPSNNVPIILCGDFNSFLEVSSVTADSGFEPSSMCQLLRTGTLARDHPQHPDTWSQRKDMSHESPRLGTLQLPRDQDLLFENAYEMEEFSPFKPLFTTKTDEFQGWIDHVWINRHVQVQGVLRPPVFAMDLQASVKSNSFAPIPNKDYPSDHIPLGVVAKFS